MADRGKAYATVAARHEAEQRNANKPKGINDITDLTGTGQKEEQKRQRYWDRAIMAETRKRLQEQAENDARIKALKADYDSRYGSNKKSTETPTKSYQEEYQDYMNELADRGLDRWITAVGSPVMLYNMKTGEASFEKEPTEEDYRKLDKDKYFTKGEDGKYYLNQESLANEDFRRKKENERRWEEVDKVIAALNKEKYGDYKLKPLELGSSKDKAKASSEPASKTPSSSFNANDYANISFVGPEGGWKHIENEDDLLAAMVLNKLYPGLVKGFGAGSGFNYSGTPSVSSVPEESKLPEDLAKRWEEFEKLFKKVYGEPVSEIVDEVGKTYWNNNRQSQGTWTSEKLQQTPENQKTNLIEMISNNATKE